VGAGGCLGFLLDSEASAIFVVVVCLLFYMYMLFSLRSYEVSEIV
jgi:transposase